MLSYNSPAKLNLFLHTIQKREDGFTEILSFFQAVDLQDTIQIQKAEKDELTCSHPSIPLDSSNTILRALDLFREKTNLSTPVHIHLEKKIPIEAGLGGGSSNAATTLWALNELFQQKLSNTTLQEWGAEIGSDVPFFFATGQALVKGRGEIIEPLHLEKFFSCWLAKPEFGLSAKEVYQALDFSKVPKRSFLENIDSMEYVNDLEIPAFALQPRLRKIREHLLNMGFSQVVMTGSGSTFFCLGNVTPKPIDDLSYYSVQGTQRTFTSWY